MLRKHCKLFLSLILTALGCLGIAAQANASGVVTIAELDTVSNADFQDVPPTLMGDVWTFEVKKSGEVIVQVNTRDDNGDSTSNLDPVAFLSDESGGVALGVGDDEFKCISEPVCGFACPAIGPIFLEKGKYKIVVRDFNTASVTNKQCNGGAYTLIVTGRVKKLKLIKDDKNVIFDPLLSKETLETLMTRTNSGDKLNSLLKEVQMIESVK